MTSLRITTIALSALLAGTAFAQAKPDLKDPKLRASYAIGWDIGSKMNEQGLELDPKAIAIGLADAFGGKPALTPAEMAETLKEFSNTMRSKMEAKQNENAKKGEAFLAANAKKDGVKATASGLQYQVVKSGSGKTPKSTDTVKVHYHGTLTDGTVFDSSVDRGEPVSFSVDGVIPGWTEALQLMKEGDKWKLFIPAKLAYGENSPGGKIGPFSPPPKAASGPLLFWRSCRHNRELKVSGCSGSICLKHGGKAQRRARVGQAAGGLISRPW